MIRRSGRLTLRVSRFDRPVSPDTRVWVSLEVGGHRGARVGDWERRSATKLKLVRR